MIQNNSNEDIDPARAYLNYSLTPERPTNEYDYYKQRKSELYCYGRSDVKTMAGWIVTAPKELQSRDEEFIFFQNVYNFLEERYGKENVILAEVHYDEGKTEKQKDRWGQYIKDQNGNIKKTLVLGRPHLHFNFIPTVKDNNPKHTQEEKICANGRLNKIELQNFHKDLQAYLKLHGIKGADEIINGKTKEQGRNYSVEELKENYERAKEMERLRELERLYRMERERTIVPTSEKGTRWS